MSTSPLRETPNVLTSDEPQALLSLLFEYPGADFILRSNDSHHFRVPKSHIVHCSPVLDDLTLKALKSPDDADAGESLPVVQLPESGAILHSLLTFIFPVTPLVPSTTEKAMELLSVAQKYQMTSVLAHIRYSIARQNPPSTQRDTALLIYSLAQKHGLHQEALQAAQAILKYPMSIEELEDRLDMMPGAALYELWKYYEKVRAILASDLTEFKASDARGALAGFRCTASDPSQMPHWLDEFIESIGDAPHFFDFIEFNAALGRHMYLKDEGGNHKCVCVSIPSKTIRNFWETLTSVVHDSFENAGSALSLVQEREDSQAQVNSTTSLLDNLDVSDANVIIRSSDLVNFRVHKSVLVMASPFFGDLLSLPQPPDSESIDGIPVVQLPEDAELMNSLVSMLYPVRPVVPHSYEKLLYLLAACQKYDMVQVQSFIRDKVNCGYLAPVGTEAFRAYAIASGKGLIPEMEKAARLTLDHPMTFETLGDALQLFDGCALRDLARFRKLCRDRLVRCLGTFLKADASGPSSIWIGCPETTRSSLSRKKSDVLPSWLRQVLSRNKDILKLQVFTHPFPTPSSICGEYLAAIQNHTSCTFCSGVYVMKGSMFSTELESKLARAREEVPASFLWVYSARNFTSQSPPAGSSDSLDVATWT